MSDTTQKKPDPVLLWWNGLSKENKTSIFATAGAVAAAAALAFLVCIPSLEEHDRLAAESADLQEQVRKANDLLAKTSEKEESAQTIESETNARIQEDTLEPLNGSLAAAATLKLSPFFDNHRVSVMGQGSMGQQNGIIPASEAKALPADVRYFTRQPITFRGQAAYWDFVDMLHDVATNYPTATLTTLSIMVNPSSKDTQDLAFTFEWPVIADKPSGKK